MSRFLVALQNTATPAQITDVVNHLWTSNARPLQAWGHSVLIAEDNGNAAVQQAVAGRPGVAHVAGGPIPNFNALPNLDALAQEVAGGWNFGFLPAFLNPLPPSAPLASALAPGGCNDGTSTTAAAPFVGVTANGLLGSVSGPGLALAPQLQHTNRRALVGTIGVAVLYVDGPAGTAAQFSADDSFFAMKGLQLGLDQLHNLAPKAAHLLFTPYPHRVKINVNPSTIPTPANPANPQPSEYNAAEAPWRDAALTQLGLPTGRAGFRKLVDQSKFLFKPDWGFVVAITKYRAAWPGYAPDYRDVVISYEMQKTGVGLAHLPYAFAHEICHTVEALDEYQPNCSVFHTGGFSKLPNLNCKGPLPTGNPLSVPCIMRDLGSFAVCPTTRSHFGWGDHNGDGVLDPYDPTFPSP